jgi:hypothetical protein
MRSSSPKYRSSSFRNRSTGKVLSKNVEAPKRTFVQVRKKNVGPSKYKNTISTKVSSGKRSKKKEKKRTSATNIIEPGNPKKTKRLKRLTKNNFGHKKFKPLISVTNRVLKRRPIASTNRNEFVDKRAWLINIQKLARKSGECPLITQIANQCISTTVE